ncbi:MAG: hypothetical protein F4099_03170 [Synechococcus sp. SB0673_bin_10]|nr:hypothetical protein [Synechococcus sp. SB0667_bin_8]MYF36776.1 hypothetical protein [Synechococcus sp. SB0678_bin_12]MYG63536.1 hypothetical protein [Synechococcus sp. SB0675_bin_7]MYI71514.1 hypothetical protein [Synechococcus sp. SB0673_bin_10]MYK86382.1 hypothetical protein [Synechococcus sp. SB0669_bin_7]
MTSKSPAARLSDKPLKDLTVVELKDLCQERGIKGFSHKPKARLLEMIEAAASGTSSAKSAADESAADASNRPRHSKSGLKKKSKARKTTYQAKGQHVDLDSLTIAQLKQFCKDQGIKGFARKNKQQLLGLISPVISPESSNNQTETTDAEKEQDHDHLSVDNALMDGPDSDRFYSGDSEDLDANQVVQEESDDELSSAELDPVKENFEDQFDGNGEDAMVEVSDSLIFELLDRFDRIEALLQRIAGSVDHP